MLKNTQFKIIIIFFLVGILLISGLGIFFLNSLNMIYGQVQGTQPEHLINIVNQMKENTDVALIIAAVVFTIITLLIAFFLSRFVIYPINKLIQSAEKIAEEDKNINKPSKGKKKSEVGN